MYSVETRAPTPRRSGAPHGPDPNRDSEWHATQRRSTRTSSGARWRRGGASGAGFWPRREAAAQSSACIERTTGAMESLKARRL